MDEDVAKLIAGVLLLGLIMGGGCAFSSCSCATKAKAMDLKSSSWGPIQGCIVETQKGQKIDIDRYRVIED